MSIEEILYCIGMESPTGWEYMEQLCQATGVKYPPRSSFGKRDSRKDEYMPDPLEESQAEGAANRQIAHDQGEPVAV